MMHIVRKRHILLLEILIAIMLIVLCILPLLAPHATFFNEQKKFTNTLTTSRNVNLIHADLVERLHRNEIPWTLIEEGHLFPIDEALSRLHIENFPYIGTYQFEEEIHKAKDEWAAYHFIIYFSLKPRPNSTEKPMELAYHTCIVRHVPEQTDDEDEESDSDDSEEKSDESKEKPEEASEEEDSTE